MKSVTDAKFESNVVTFLMLMPQTGTILYEDNKSDLQRKERPIMIGLLAVKMLRDLLL